MELDRRLHLLAEPIQTLAEIGGSVVHHILHDVRREENAANPKRLHEVERTVRLFQIRHAVIDTRQEVAMHVRHAGKYARLKDILLRIQE